MVWMHHARSFSHGDSRLLLTRDFPVLFNSALDVGQLNLVIYVLLLVSIVPVSLIFFFVSLLLMTILKLSQVILYYKD